MEEGAHPPPIAIPFGCQSGPLVSTIHSCFPFENFPQGKSTICSAHGPCRHLEAKGQLFVISVIFMMLITHYDA